MKQKVLNGLYILLTAALLLFGYLFEKPFGVRIYILAGIVILYLIFLALFFMFHKALFKAIIMIGLFIILLGIEVFSKYAVNYFFHSLYTLQLLLIIFNYDKRKGLALIIPLSVCSFIKFIELVVIQPSTGNIAMFVFFGWTQVLFILIFTFFKIYREESVKNKSLYEELLVTYRKLEQSIEDLKVLTRMQERASIAGDLHDTLGHELTGLIMQMEMASRLMEKDPRKGSSILEDAKQSARDSLSTVRTIVDTLKNDEENEWSQSTLMELVEHFREVTGANIIFKTSGKSIVSPDISLALYRLVQEALTNAVRHGMATEIDVSINHLETRVEFEVKDNGKGCDHPDYGNGLSTMSERIKALQGCLSFDGSNGFLIKGYIPYSPNSQGSGSIGGL